MYRLFNDGLHSISHGSTGISPYKMIYSQEMGFQIYIITKQIVKMLQEPKCACLLLCSGT